MIDPHEWQEYKSKVDDMHHAIVGDGMRAGIRDEINEMKLDIKALQRERALIKWLNRGMFALGGFIAEPLANMIAKFINEH